VLRMQRLDLILKRIPMKPQRLALIVVVLILLTASWWWIFSDAPQTPAGNREWTGKYDVPVHVPTTSTDLVRGVPTIAPEELRSRVFSSLMLPSQRDRLREFCDLLRLVTKENAETVRETIDLLRRREGRGSEVALALLKKHLEWLANGGPDAPLPPRSGEIAVDLKALAEIPDEVEKMLRLFDILDDIGESNWRKAYDGIETDLALDPLRRARGEMIWATIAERVGPTAIGEIWNQKPADACYLARLWSQSHASAAIAWIDTLTDRKQQLAFTNNIALGVASTDPYRALSTLQRFPGNLQTADFFVYRLADEFGIRTAEAFYTALRQDPRTPEATVQNAFKFLSQARELMLFRGLSADVGPALEWLDAYTPTGKQPATTFLGAAARVDPERTLQWLETHREQLDALTATQAYAFVAEHWQAASPKSFQAWMQANSDHPQRQIMTTVAATTKPAAK
jgi:hypothetical protein